MSEARKGSGAGAGAEASAQEGPMEAEKARASGWFTQLRNEICSSFEELERSCPVLGPGGGQASAFRYKPTKRVPAEGGDAGGGEMAMLRNGRLFEKAGVNVSTVFGRLDEAPARMLASRKRMPGFEADSRFWASGVSVVAHMANPHVPAVHFNTRMFWTPGGWWFGGGTDLNPCIEYPEDTAAFHRVLEAACERHERGRYERLKSWADEYFQVRHRKRARGVGGIFFDDLNTGDWDADFAFVREVGEAFLEAYVPIARCRMGQAFDRGDREAQLAHRGLYVEFNLVYDRGTRFGLETGHDPDAVLMSLPPLAAWP